MDFLQKIRKTLWLVDDGFEEIFSGSVAEAFGFFVMVLCIGMLLISVANFVQQQNVVMGLLVNILIYVAGLVIILPVCTHALMLALGGKGDFRDTLKAYWYGSTPMFLFGWVPCVGVFSTFVSLGNVIRALNKINGLSYGKAIISVLVSCGVFFGVFLAGVYLAAMFGLL